MKADFDVLWDFSDPASTAARFEALLAETTDPDYSNEIKSQIARCLGLQRKFDAAHELLDEIAENLTPMTTSEVRYLLERGRVLNSSGDPVLATELFRQATELAQSIGEEVLAIDAIHMLGIADSPGNRLRWNEMAIEMSQKSDNPKSKKWLASLLNNTGWTYFDSGNYSRSLELFTEARELRENMGQQSNEQVARWCIARTLRALGRNEEALTMQLVLADEVERDGYVQEELAELYVSANDIEKSAAAANRALEVLGEDAAFVTSEPDRLARLRALAKAHNS